MADKRLQEAARKGAYRAELEAQIRDKAERKAAEKQRLQVCLRIKPLELALGKVNIMS